MVACVIFFLFVCVCALATIHVKTISLNTVLPLVMANVACGVVPATPPIVYTCHTVYTMLVLHMDCNEYLNILTVQENVKEC